MKQLILKDKVFEPIDPQTEFEKIKNLSQVYVARENNTLDGRLIVV